MSSTNPMANSSRPSLVFSSGVKGMFREVINDLLDKVISRLLNRFMEFYINVVTSSVAEPSVSIPGQTKGILRGSDVHQAGDPTLTGEKRVQFSFPNACKRDMKRKYTQEQEIQRRALMSVMEKGTLTEQDKVSHTEVLLTTTSTSCVQTVNKDSLFSR